jgi:hypothetical protein
MMGLGYNASVATACVLKEIFIIFPPNPKTNKVIINCVTESANPSMGSVLAYRKADTIRTIRLPYLATRKPATGREVSKPTGRQSRIPPRAALFSCNFACISGIRDAQEAKQIPARKKKLLTAIR